MSGATQRWSGRLAVDGVFFQLFVTGVARVWRELFLEWAAQGFAAQVTIFDRARTVPRIEGFSYVDLPPFDFANPSEDRARLSEACRRIGAHAFASSYFTIADGVPNLMLLYDMIPERMNYDLRHPMWQQKRHAIEAAAGIAAISENTLRDLHAIYPATVERPSVIAPVGVAARFSPPTAAEVESFRRGFAATALGGKPHLLFVSGGEGTKNGALVRRVLRDWSKRRKFSLLVTTAPQHARDWFVELKDMTVHAAYLSEEALRLAYGTAHCLLYPSLYEGFGMPIIEAMACGCPVICGNTASQPEVAGDAALLVDPRFPAKLLAALDQMQRDETRRNLRAKGLDRAKTFTWARTAASIDALLHRIAPA